MKIFFIALFAVLLLAGCDPQVSILSPEDGAFFTEGEEILLSGSARDYEDGELPGSALAWSSDIDGALGGGTRFATDNLTCGEHTITLTATDSDGNGNTDEIGVTVGECAAGTTTTAGANLDGLDLSAVEFWGYQIQDIAEPGAVDLLADSRYDMLVVEPTRTDWSSDTKYFDTRGMVERLKNTRAHDGIHRKLIIAYIDIGEAEDWRWYWTWSTAWEPGEPKPDDWPDFIITHDPDGWTGNYPVAYWDAAWKDIVIYGENQDSSPYGDYTSIIDETVTDGFDGIYLDWVEAFENEEVARAARDAGRDPAQEMIAFIQEMRAYAEKRVPGFLIVQQNAASLADGHDELYSAIDAIAQEAIWYDGDATDNWNDPRGHDSINDDDLVDYYTDYLERYLRAGVPVFDCEYALLYADDAYEKSHKLGSVPYVTRRSLGKLTTTPPPEY